MGEVERDRNLLSGVDWTCYALLLCLICQVDVIRAVVVARALRWPTAVLPLSSEPEMTASRWGCRRWQGVATRSLSVSVMLCHCKMRLPEQNMRCIKVGSLRIACSRQRKQQKTYSMPCCASLTISRLSKAVKARSAAKVYCWLAGCTTSTHWLAHRLPRCKVVGSPAGFFYLLRVSGDAYFVPSAPATFCDLRQLLWGRSESLHTRNSLSLSVTFAECCLIKVVAYHPK
jgi:hypothetical protein